MIQMCRGLANQSPVEGHLIIFRLLLLQVALQWIALCMCVVLYFVFPSVSKSPGSGIVGSKRKYVISLDIAKFPSKGVFLFCIPLIMYRVLFPHNHKLLDFCQSHRCGMVSQHSFNLDIPCYKCGWAFSICEEPFKYLFLWTFHISCPFFHRAVVQCLLLESLYSRNISLSSFLVYNFSSYLANFFPTQKYFYFLWSNWSVFFLLWFWIT